MRKRLKYIILILITAIFLLVVFGIVTRSLRLSNLERSIQFLPDFSFNTLDGPIFRSESIKAGPVLVAYYHPECEHCRYEINEILKNRKQISDIKIILISFAQKDSIIAFIGDRLNNTDENILLLIDDSLKFSEYFSTRVIPSTFIYDKELKLKKFYKGEVKPETIIRLLTAND